MIVLGYAVELLWLQMLVLASPALAWSGPMRARNTKMQFQPGDRGNHPPRYRGELANAMNRNDDPEPVDELRWKAVASKRRRS